jgi:hypothetical protein
VYAKKTTAAVAITPSDQLCEFTATATDGDSERRLSIVITDWFTCWAAHGEAVITSSSVLSVGTFIN